jgi:hypothetical protein
VLLFLADGDRAPVGGSFFLSPTSEGEVEMWKGGRRVCYTDQPSCFRHVVPGRKRNKTGGWAGSRRGKRANGTLFYETSTTATHTTPPTFYSTLSLLPCHYLSLCSFPSTNTDLSFYFRLFRLRCGQTVGSSTSLRNWMSDTFFRHVWHNIPLWYKPVSGKRAPRSAF